MPRYSFSKGTVSGHSDVMAALRAENPSAFVLSARLTQADFLTAVFMQFGVCDVAGESGESFGYHHHQWQWFDF